MHEQKYVVLLSGSGGTRSTLKNERTRGLVNSSSVEINEKDDRNICGEKRQTGQREWRNEKDDGDEIKPK